MCSKLKLIRTSQKQRLLIIKPIEEDELTKINKMPKSRRFEKKLSEFVNKVSLKSQTFLRIIIAKSEEDPSQRAVCLLQDFRKNNLSKAIRVC